MDKAWYALNRDLCCVPPQQFCERKIFKLFPEEVQSLPLEDIRSENGGLSSPKWFNGGQRSKNDVFVGTPFAVLVASLRRKDPGNSQLLKNDSFGRILEHINTLDLANIYSSQSNAAADPNLSAAGFFKAQNSILVGQLEVYKTEIEALKSQLEQSIGSNEPDTQTQSPPKTPCPPKTNRSTSSSPSSRGSPSIEDIEPNENYSPEFKKRKVREKAFSIFNELETVAKEHGAKDLAAIISRCCLLEHERRIDKSVKPSTMVKEIVSTVTVCDEKGAVNGFESLISSETWTKYLEEKRVPDWQFLLCKLEVLLSDDGWQKVLSRTNIGRSGVSTYFIVYNFVIYVF